MIGAAAAPLAGAIVGGKAARLRELQHSGFRVPEFVVSPANAADAVRQLGFPLAVRSSASLEDGGAASFAGQFVSFLDLRTLDDVEEAMRACRASIEAPSVVEYCRKHGINRSALAMNVIVQRMVTPELAGVAFTINPHTGADEVVIDACEGLAADLLAGRGVPLASDHPLVRRYAPGIERVARRIQEHFGAPQDIEFAIQDGAIYILQARPITRIGFAAELGEWTNADFRDGGVSSTVCTPLMWSLYDYIWEDALKGFLLEIRLFGADFQAGRLFFGRPYWNLGEVKRCLLKLPGFVERDFDEDLSVAITYDGNGQQTPVTPVGVLRALPTVFAIESIWKAQERFDRDFLSGGFDRLVRSFDASARDNDASFERFVTGVYKTTETNYFRTIFCTSLAKLDFKSSFPDADYAALAGGLPPMQHLEPARVIREMASRGGTDLAALLERFAHHSRRELDICAPRWDEDRDWVAGLVHQPFAGHSGDARAAYHSARASALASISPWKRRSFARKLDRLRNFVWLREELRDLSSRVYHLLRRRVKAIAERRGLGDDIFFMTVHEIIEDDRSNIARGRALYDAYRNFEAPHEIGRRFAVDRTPAAASSAPLHGIAVSHGRATGIARVARTVEEAAAIRPGEILVSVFTDPGWTTLLDRAAAVVTETGGLLSHAAVICREYGIPAVLGVNDATRRIRNGGRIAVDGTAGTVSVLDERQG